jgi:hypothetical protein
MLRCGACGRIALWTIAEGHQVTCVSDSNLEESREVKQAIAQIQTEHSQQEAQNVAEAAELSQFDYATLKEQRIKFPLTATLSSIQAVRFATVFPSHQN